MRQATSRALKCVKENTRTSAKTCNFFDQLCPSILHGICEADVAGNGYPIVDDVDIVVQLHKMRCQTTQPLHTKPPNNAMIRHPT